MKIKEIVANNVVNFKRYRKGYLYYVVIVNSSVYEFPVPVEDCGDADFHDTDKAILFMRYIRKALEDGTFVKVADADSYAYTEYGATDRDLAKVSEKIEKESDESIRVI